MKTISPLSIILISALLLGLILFYNRNLVADLIQSVSNVNYMQSFRVKMLGQNLIQIIGLYIIFTLNLALFIVLAYKLLSTANTSLPIFLLMLMFPAIYFVRHLILFAFGWIFELELESGTFSFVIALMNMIIGFLLIPINLFIAFSPAGLAKVFVFIGIFVIGAAVVMRHARGALIASKHIIGNSFQFFLYFCTFEIAPVLIILYFLGLK